MLLGGAGGSFGAATTFPTGLSPTGSAIADFNGDSNNDIVFADQDSGTFSVLVSDLLRNSNAEADAGSDDGLDDVDLTNWTETGAATAVQYGAAGFPTDAQAAAFGGGSNFFAGGSGAATSTATQNWTVPASSADDIDAGGVTANLSGHLGGFADQGDDASVGATFLDAGGAKLAGFKIGPATPAQRGNATGLLYRSKHAAVPAGTRKIRSAKPSGASARVRATTATPTTSARPSPGSEPADFSILSRRMADDRATLKAQPRTDFGSRESRRLRRSGFVPGVVYGAGEEARAFQAPARAVRDVLLHGGALFDVEIEGSAAVPVAAQGRAAPHPVRDDLVHLDLHEVKLDEEDRGRRHDRAHPGTEDAPGRQGGRQCSSTSPMRSTISALPTAIPESIPADVSGMVIGDTLQLPAP